MGEADDAERGEVAAAFAEGDAGAVVHDSEGDDRGEAEVERLDHADGFGGRFAEAGARRFLDAEAADAWGFFYFF